MSDTLPLADHARAVGWSRFAAYIELTKPRVASLVLVATAVGYFLALPAIPDITAFIGLASTILGITLVAGSANAMNQLIEVRYDAMMTRTQDRPLVTNRLTPYEVLVSATIACILGISILAIQTNLLAAALALLSFTSYVFVYTPLKRTTTLCVIVGAVPGALPPVIGWAAATGTIPLEAWLLFAIVFVWQLPHVAAIAWLHKEDYQRADFAMLPVVDPSGLRTCLHMITHSITLLTVSFLPIVYGLAGTTYLLGAMILGVSFLLVGVAFVWLKTAYIARVHLFSSITYLPALFAAMMVDKVGI